jgi:hypothetical protein
MVEVNLPAVFPVINANANKTRIHLSVPLPYADNVRFFYEDCPEMPYHSGLDGYPLGYGKKYSHKLNTASDKSSQKGQIWMLDMMECLQGVLVREANGPRKQGRSPCDKLRERAFEIHAEDTFRTGCKYFA